jgi:PAS domain S-box-containing protein
VAERRAALIGYVYSPFHADDLLNGALGEQEHRSIELQVYDGTELTPDNLLHQSDVNADSRTPHFTETRVIPLAGRKWTLVFTSRPEFEYGSGRYLVPISLIGGLMVSFTVFGVARSLARARDVAESSALSLAESQAALRENEARLRRFVDSNIIGVVIGDLKGRVIEANDAFLKVVGYTRQDIITGALNLTEITPPEYRPLDKAAIEEMKRTGSHPPFEKEYVRKDSSRVPVLLGTAYLAGPSQLWVGFLLDLTERKRAEVALREADQLAINAYEALLERLTALAQALGTARDLLAIYRALREFAVASVPCVGVLITLYDARRDVCGAAYAWGEGEEFDVSAMAPFPVSGTDPNTRAVKTGQVVIVNDYAEAPEGHGLVIVGARDGIQPESCMVAPLAVMGRIVGTMEVQSYEPDAYKNEHIVAIRMAANLAAAAIENVQLLESESRARALAEESNRMKDEFLATVSHELRTPLTAILGWARMLPMGGFDEATIARAIETIERNATAQARIIDDILDVSRVITGKLKMDVKRVEMSAVVDAAINSIRPAAEAKGIKLKVDIAPGEQIVSGDPDRLQQVAWNLLSNAVKFTRSGGTVSATLRRVGPEIKLTVIDSGEGISPAFLPYVFDRFRQADSSSTREHGGLGLGLAIVRHLVELHGGRVEAASEGAGKGSTFSVILPVAVSPARVEAPVAALQPTTPVMSKNGKESLSGVHVLVVDDERDTVDMVQAVLARDGATVSTACSVYEALESIARCEPDVIVSDIGMPELDGYDFIKRVRAVEKISGKHIPAIALTAYVRSDERDMAFSAGYEEHISKPVDPDMLVAAIAGLTRS